MGRAVDAMERLHDTAALLRSRPAHRAPERMVEAIQSAPSPGGPLA